MNIWMLNHYAITPDHPGGTRHFELAKNLSSKGHNVTIFASNFIHMNFHTIELPRETGGLYKTESRGGFRFIWVKSRSYQKNDLNRLLNMMDYCRAVSKSSQRLVKREELEKPDVIIGSTVHPFAPLTAAKLAKKFKARFVFEIRDLWPQTFIDMRMWRPNSIQSRVFRFIEKRSVKNAEKIIALSPQTESYLQDRYGCQSTDICYIPNGVYIDDGKSSSHPVDEETPETITRLAHIREDGAFVVLYSGSLISSNKLEAIIEAAERLEQASDSSIKNLELVLIGKGQEEARYRKLIQDKKLRNISILPPVPKECVAPMLRMADVLLLHQGNVQWGSSNKLYDYLASGRPIISSVHAKHNDIVGRVGGGISITPGSPQELVQAIRSIHDMPANEREQMARRNEDFVKENHDWRLLAEKLDNLLKGLNW